MKILNLANGKVKPLDIIGSNHYILNVDTMNTNSIDKEQVDHKIRKWNGITSEEEYICEQAKYFMETTITIFDWVCIYRYLEHVTFTEVLYFIYLISTVTKKGSVVDVIVPNYETLAKMILEDDPYSKEFESKNILLTTELLNEPYHPHASIWTEKRIKYFWELERRFEVPETSIIPNYNFDGRNIYIRFQAIRK